MAFRPRLLDAPLLGKTFRVSYFMLFALALSLVVPDRFNPWPSFAAFWTGHTAGGGAVPDATDVGDEIAAAERALAGRPRVPANPGVAAPVPPCRRDPSIPLVFGHLTVPCLPGDPDGAHALSRFRERLEATRQGGGLTRISYFADSIAAGDKITSTLRKRFQRTFGDGGPGYVALFPLRTWHYHSQVALRLSAGWEPQCPIGHPSRERRYGFGGIAIEHQGRGNTVRLALRQGAAADVVQIHFLRHPEGASFAVTADGRELGLVDTRGPRHQEGHVRLKAAAPFHNVELESRTAGLLRLSAAFLERDAAGVVVDGVSLTGVRYENWGAFPEEHLRAEVAARAPDLVAFQLGLNESDTGVEDDYPQVIRGLFARLKAARPLSCLVVGPTDKVEKTAGGYRTLPVIRRIARLQREAALAAGCAWFDTHAAMGGEAAIVRWYEHQPRLATGDLTHITVEGGELLGDLIYHDLLLALGAR